MKRSTAKICVIVFAAYCFFSVAFYFIAGEDFRQTRGQTAMLSPKTATGELFAGQPLTQMFVAEFDTVDAVTVWGATFARSNDDILEVYIKDDSGAVLASEKVKTAGLPDNASWTVKFSSPAKEVRGKTLTLTIISANGKPGNAVTFFYGDSVNTGKFEISVRTDYPLSVNGNTYSGALCLSVQGMSYYRLADYYWYMVGLFGLLLAIFLLRMLDAEKKGKPTIALKAVSAFSKYHFLLKQLVNRDFKTKYKRSVLGMFWSFLNPLMTMLVMYIVFSTLFKNSIPNFSVYLLTGIICWNFFSEVSGMCLSSITGNAALIMKVYVPKYMYPFSRAVSSFINFALSLIPLFIVIIAAAIPFRPSFLLIPIPILCLFFFSLGIGLCLASAMVFFRDVQFLWGVVSMLWMYLTPIFYDVSIIPAKLMPFYKLNPLYHILRIFRIMLINGVSPEPKAYLLCILASFLPFILGVWVFKKTQNRFVLYL